MRLRAAGCPRISARADGYFFREKTTIEKEDSMKVVVAGAGLGGLVAAEKLGRLGLDVTVYEKAASLDEMRYDWHDDVNPRIFRRLSIDMPEERFKKKSWTFVSPFGEVVREFRQDEEHADYSVERRPLNKLLCDRAAEVAKIVFGAKVTAPVVQEGRVAGIIVNGEEVPADLVVDAMGVDSALRKALPRELGITECRDDEVFVAYRAFYEKDTEAPAPRYTNKAYLKHMGEAGISWAIQDNDPGLVNVLVGRLGKMTDKQLADALADLKKNNPTIGNRVMRGGIVCRIPVRYPATRMVADGYAAVGDSAYMTIPMLGSGIASSMLAGMLLAQTVGENMSRGYKGKELFKASRLWRYQVKVYREFGAEHCAIDVLKRGVLNMNNEMLDWMLGSDLLTNDEIGKLAGGGMMRVGVAEAFRKTGVAGFKKLGKLLKINNMLQKSLMAYRCAKNIPRNYNDNIIKGWESRLAAYYRKPRKEAKQEAAEK